MTRLRQICVVLAVIVAVGLSRLHELFGVGVSVSDWSAQADSTLRAAGYAFAVWGLLYAGMIAFAVYQVTPRGRRSALAALLGWPAAIAFLACGVWVVAAVLQVSWLTVVIILVGATAMNERLMGAAGADARAAERWDRWLVLWPLAGLAGWLTVASALNIVSVIERNGWLAAIPSLAVGAVAVLAVVAISLFVALRTRSLAHPALVAWGLAAVAVAERAEKPVVATIAAAGALACLAGGFVLSRRPR